ncbi:unannotated protein [freshwater metagenome]|uniref:Unannotated protein n=1 Tax=freshwater metagenome TaxID=449393 RepID=A0A6J6QE09_9ZZZZ
MGGVRLEGRQESLGVLVAHHADDRDQRREGEGVLQGRAHRLRPVRVVRRVEHDRRAAPHDLEAARRGDLGEGGPHQVGVEGLVPEERLDRREGDGGVLRLVGAVERQEDLVVAPAQPLEGDHLTAYGRHPVGDPEVAPLADHTGSDLGDLAIERGVDVLGLGGDHGDRAGLDDAGLLDRDLAWGLAEVARVVDRDRQHDGDRCVDDVGGVPRAAHADLDDGRIDGGVGEGREGHRHDRLEEGDRVRLVVVDQREERRHVVERTHEAFVAERLAVHADALGHPLDVRAGEAAGAQVEGAQQRIDHPARRGLAVGAGQVDDGVGRLRVAEQLDQRLDPVQRRLQPGLGPAREQRVLDLVEGLGQAGGGGGLTHLTGESREHRPLTGQLEQVLG